MFAISQNYIICNSLNYDKILYVKIKIHKKIQKLSKYFKWLIKQIVWWTVVYKILGLQNQECAAQKRKKTGCQHPEQQGRK